VIANLVDKIEKTVASCHKLDASMGQLMDKQALIQFADTVIAAIAEIFPTATPEQMVMLGERVTNALAGAQNPATPQSKAQPLTADALDIEDA